MKIKESDIRNMVNKCVSMISESQRMPLNESKRDELLLPYLELCRKNGKEVSLGQLKTELLALLTEKAGLRNLSLGSNYYLAGAARYYFNGNLTTDGKVGFLSGEKDNFNTEICERLNVLILILRNSLIDTVGATFEQPEDFGTLPIDKLLKKYNKKINAELGTENGKEKKGDGINRDEHIGSKGYTFDIMYSHDDCRKYERLTAPGSWCITYGQQYYNTYTRRNNAHFIIFKKDGYENIKRAEGTGFPLDAYGTSMFAVLQGNNDPLAIPQVTSRYNHGGYGVPSIDRADFVLNKSGLEKMVGITDADLQRIYTIWSTDKHKNRGAQQASETKKKNQIILREFKYKQMLLNGGAQIESVFSNISVVSGKEDAPSKSIVEGMTEIQGEKYHALVDRNKILFDTIVSDNDYTSSSNPHFATYVRSDAQAEEYDYANGGGIVKRDIGERSLYNNIIFITKSSCTLLYDTRFHKFVDVDGVIKFKHVADSPYEHDMNLGEPTYYEVKQSSTQMALIDIKTNRPLKLPNGEFWFAELGASNITNYSRELEAHIIRQQSCISILYDPSMRKVFYFNPVEKRFFEPDYDKDVEFDYAMVSGDDLNSNDLYVVELLKTINNDYGSYTTVMGRNIFKGGQKISVLGVTNFNRVRTMSYHGVKENYLCVGISEALNVIYDPKSDSVLCANGVPIYFTMLVPTYDEKYGYPVWLTLPTTSGERPTNSTFDGHKYMFFVISSAAVVWNKFCDTPYFYMREDFSTWGDPRYQIYSDSQRETYNADPSSDKRYVQPIKRASIKDIVTGARKIGGMYPQSQLVGRESAYALRESVEEPEQKHEWREEEVQDFVNATMKRIAKFLSRFNLKVKLLNNTRSEWVGQYRSRSCATGIMRFSINLDLIKQFADEITDDDNLSASEVDEEIRDQIMVTLWHECGHGLVEHIKRCRRKSSALGDGKFKGEAMRATRWLLHWDEEDLVEEFGEYMAGLDHSSDLDDYLTKYQDILQFQNAE